MDISPLIGKGLAETILSLRVNKGSICHIILVTSLFKEPKTIGSTEITKILPAGLEDWFVYATTSTRRASTVTASGERSKGRSEI